MSYKSRKRPKSLRAMTLRLAAGTLAVWLGCMAAMTLGTAQQLFDRLVTTSGEFPEYSHVISEFLYNDQDSIWDREEKTPGYLDYLMLRTLKQYRSGTGISSNQYYIAEQYGGNESILKLLPLRDKSVPMETAILFLDAEGNILHEDGDFLYFSYVSEETWQEKGDVPNIEGYGWIDLEDAGDERYAFFRERYYGQHGILMTLEIMYMRITGVWDGQRLEPVKMDYIDHDMWIEAQDKEGSAETYIDHDGGIVTKYDQSTTGLLERGVLDWAPIFDYTDRAGQTGDLVTVYATRTEICEYMGEEKPVHWDQAGYWDNYAGLHQLTAEDVRNGVKYESLKALLKDISSTTLKESWGNVCFYRCGLDEIIVLDKNYFRDLRGVDLMTATEYPATKFYMTTAIRSHPLRSAMMLMRNVYIVTFLLALLVFRWMRNQFREQLLRPVEVVNDAVERKLQYPHYYQDFDPEWEEGFDLVANYKEMREQIRMRNNEITRLETALDYARRAEVKRRQMTSNIAHELKTPLAVVHSYAEGLQENIAAEKREQYLQTILSETERMDTMVLEMLDLSRLEAGKVKLARDDFDLAALGKSVFEALARKAEEKRLEITLQLDEPVMVSADESRIRQVIENYASNAVKYTPEGGKVTVKILQERGKTVFSVENESAPLSEEALNKIWDSFYRVDESRTGRSGTGLGLAIAKSIVELHGGTVSVWNTKTGVEFRFAI